MGISKSSFQHGLDRHLGTEDPKRRLAIRLLVALSAAGLLFVVASWLAGQGAR